MSSSRRLYPTLDLLRLVAISLTMLAHARGIVEKVFFLRWIEDALWLGVDLFMLISGWLLGGQLLREASRGMFDPSRFYVKRWLRTLPPYIVMLVLLYFVGSPRVGGPDGIEYELDPSRTAELAHVISFKEIVTHLTFLQRYLPPNLYGVSWSLCVEEHFYLLLPVVVWALMRWPRLAVTAGLVVAIEVVAVACRVATFTGVEWCPQETHMRCHGLFVGLLLAWINIHRPALWARFARPSTPLGVLGIGATFLIMATIPRGPSMWTYAAVPTVATWTLACLFLACVHEASPLSRISFPGLQYLGELTYSIYLVHNVLPRAWLGGHSGEGGLKGVVVRLVLVGGCSMLLHHLVERPSLDLRDRILKRWRRPVAVPA